MNLSPSLPIDLPRLIETRLLVQGSSGSGKTVAVKRLLEQTHGKVQHLVLDVEDEYPPLRERFDYVLAGGGRDCPADARSAALLARKLLELGQSAIVNLHELKAPDRARVVRLFLESLMSAPKALWHDVLVVVEECHLWAPQSGREAESTSAVIDLATRGRKRGFALVAVTQRISDLHKSVVAQAGNRLIGKTTLDADMKRAAYELGFSGRDQAQELARVGRGEFFVVGPALSDRVVRAQISPISTTHGSARGARAAAPPPPREAVKRILAELADLPAEAELEAKTVEDLRGKVGRLERELAAAKRAPGAEISTAVIENAKAEARREFAAECAREARAHVAGIVASANAGRERVARALDQALERLKRAADAVREPIDVPDFTQPPASMLAGRTPQPRAAASETSARAVRAIPPTAARVDPSPGLSRAQQRILDELLRLEGWGLAPADKTQLALWCDVSPTSGGYFNNLGALRASFAMIEYPSPGTVALTDLGRAAARAPEPMTDDEMRETIYARVGTAKAAILRALVAQYPEHMSKDELAEAVDVSKTSGGYFNNLGALRSLGLLDYPAPGRVAARRVLFLDT